MLRGRRIVMSGDAAARPSLPEKGSSWSELRERLEDLGKNDADWRSARTAVYVFNAGDDVLQVAKEAYALYQSENALGPLAFPSLKRMEEEVVGMGLSLLHAPAGAKGNITSGGTESILMAVKTCRDE
jgi:sphinganine-1-phosphate aldolase